MRFILVVALLAPSAAAAQNAVGTVIDAERVEIGEVTLETMASGTVRVAIDVEGLPEGVLGIHLHETGDCSADDFSSAGGHIAGDRMHGFAVEGGPHPGDLPNATVQSDGVLVVEYMNDLLALDETMIFDEDGSAFVVHSGPDDYESQPSGDAGSRIACAELAPAT